MAREIPVALSYDDVLLVPQKSDVESRRQVDLSTQLTPRINLKIPLISANMSDVTGVDMAITLGRLGGLGILPRFHNIEEQVVMVGKVKEAGVTPVASLGIKEGFMREARELVKAGVSILTVDVAHGYMSRVARVTEALRAEFRDDIDLIVGNIVTQDAARDLYNAGADCVKVGVGPGSICTTRVETGSGYPQFSAVDNIGEVARILNKTLIADGGIRSPGDVVKALGVGASAVMMGGQFAGTTEAPGELVNRDGKKYKEYNGSTSGIEKSKHVGNGVVKGDEQEYQEAIEGVSSLVLYKGPVEAVVRRFVSGIRSGLSYSGAHNIEELWTKAVFVRITDGGLRESHPHDVILQKE